MPMQPKRICSRPGCLNYGTAKGLCDKHTVARSGKWKDKDGENRKTNYGSFWGQLRARIMKRDGYLCQPCKHKNRLTKAVEVDHIIPKSSGGHDNLDNLQSICRKCHAIKTNAEAVNGRLDKPDQNT